MTDYNWQFCDEHNESYEDGDSCPYCRIRELKAKLERVRELPRYASIKCGSSHPKAPDGTFVRFDELDEALADD